MPEPKVTTRVTVELFSTTITVGQLAKVLAEQSSDDIVHVHFSKGVDPRERDTVRLEIGPK